MEVAPVLWIEIMGMIQPWPEEESRLSVTIRPFQWEVNFKDELFLKLKRMNHVYSFRKTGLDLLYSFHYPFYTDYGWFHQTEKQTKSSIIW